MLVRDVIQGGIDDGSFDVPDANVAARALISLCVDISRWYSEEERVDPQQLGETYADLALRLVARCPAGKSKPQPAVATGMQALAITERGAAAEIVDVADRAPEAGEGRGAGEAASVNGFDVAVAAGHLWDSMSHEFPVVLGRDFAGRVESVGA